MIRDNKIYQIDGVIASSSQADMKSMDNSLLELYRNRQITKETALKYSSNPEMLKRSSYKGLPFFISEGCPAAKNLIVFTMCRLSSIPQCFTVNSISFL